MHYKLFVTGFLLYGTFGVTPATLLAIANVGEPEASATAKRPAAAEAELRRELLERVKKDQEARNKIVQLMKEGGIGFDKENAKKLAAEAQAKIDEVGLKLKNVDEENTRWLDEVVEKHGWPTISLVGRDGANAAWLLVQHANRNPAFQRKCLDLMTALPKSEVAMKDVAYLTDRVLLKEGKKQLYGTQFTTEGGKWVPRPLEDEANVDSRRLEVGLPPLAEYVKTLAEVYGGPK